MWPDYNFFEVPIIFWLSCYISRAHKDTLKKILKKFEHILLFFLLCSKKKKEYQKKSHCLFVFWVPFSILNKQTQRKKSKNTHFCNCLLIINSLAYCKKKKNIKNFNINTTPFFPHSHCTQTIYIFFFPYSFSKRKI